MSDVMTEDIQRLILDKLSSPRDHARFSCVCKLWYSIYKERKFPWLLTDDDNENHKCGFLSVYDQKVYRFSAPELEEKKICGSSHGWLVTIDREHALGLYDPFSKTFIQLPISPFKEQHVKEWNGSLIRKAILSCNPRTNPNECMIMLLDQTDYLAYCKLGDESWTPISTMIDGKFINIDDFIFHKGDFVILCRFQVYICHIDPEPHFTPFGPEMSAWPNSNILVSLEGDVVIVYWYHSEIVVAELGEDEEDEVIMESHYDVYKLDKEMNSWKKENEIGDRILFLGLNESIALSTCLVPNSIANTIHGDKEMYHLKIRKNIFDYPRDVADHHMSSLALWLIQN